MLKFYIGSIPGRKNKKEIEKRVNFVLETLKIYRYRNRPAGMLSGGEKQRVAIARALVKNPDIILADEPTGNLDSATSRQIMLLLKAISTKKCVIVVTHNANIAKVADRVIRLSDGKIISNVKNENVLDIEDIEW